MACPSRPTARPGLGPAETTDQQRSKSVEVLITEAGPHALQVGKLRQGARNGPVWATMYVSWEDPVCHTPSLHCLPSCHAVSESLEQIGDMEAQRGGTLSSLL